MEKQDLGENNVNASRQIHGKASVSHFLCLFVQKINLF